MQHLLIDEANSSEILQRGKTPERWVEVFAARGVHLSARTVRAEARRLGACKILGKAMILLPEHIDNLFKEPESRPSNSIDRPSFSTSKVLERLEKMERRRRG